MNNIISKRQNPSICMHRRIFTCKKGINNFWKIRYKHGGKKKVLEEIDSIKPFRIEGSIGLLNQEEPHIQSDLESVSQQFTKPTDFLTKLRDHIPTEIISKNNYKDIENIADVFTNNITSFFGFETELQTIKSRSDYLLAVSSKNDERKELLQQLEQDNNHNFSKTEWKNIKNLVSEWNNPTSSIYQNVLGVWLEFDTAHKNKNTIPSVFLHTTNLNINHTSDIDKCLWVTQKAIPLLSGKSVPKEIEEKFLESLKKLPKEASVFHVASMLSRNTDGIRIVIKRLVPEKIVPYLESLGWKDQSGKLNLIINEIKQFSTTIRLHINITDKIDEKIGLECFIKPDKYHEVNGWESFFDYLVQKGICNPKLSEALLNFPGVEVENRFHEFSLEDFQPSVKLNDDTFSKALVRYISHVKIVYSPNKDFEAKAYTGIRMFSMNQ